MCPGEGDASADELMAKCFHERDLKGAECVKQAETCMITLQQQV